MVRCYRGNQSQYKKMLSIIDPKKKLSFFNETKTKNNQFLQKGSNYADQAVICKKIIMDKTWVNCKPLFL